MRVSIEEIESEYIIDVGDWAEIYPGLTWNRVQAAAKSLDKTNPEWRKSQNHFDLMLARVAERNPQLIERWTNKSSPKRKRGRRKAEDSTLSFIIVIAIIIWVIWKTVSK